MIFILCIICPPLAVLIKKPGAIITNILLCCLMLLPGIIHAFVVVGQANADKRANKIVKAVNKQNQTTS